MPTSPSFVEHALELLSGVGPIQARRMFGGFGISLNGHNIGIIDDDLLFLKVDDQTRPQFEAQGAKPFTVPMKKGPMVSKGYFSLPEEAVDDPDIAVKWGRLASEAALRAASAKKPKKRASSKPMGKASSAPVTPASKDATRTARKSSAGRKGSAKKASRTVGKASSEQKSSAKKASRTVGKASAGRTSSAMRTSTRKQSRAGASPRGPSGRKGASREGR